MDARNYSQGTNYPFLHPQTTLFYGK